MSPRARLYIVCAVAIAFISVTTTGFYCAVSYIRGQNLNSRAFRALQEGQFETAIPLYTAASCKILGSTTRALVYGNRGWCYAKTDRDDQAIRDFTESIRIDPRPVYSVFDRGLAYYRKGLFDQAVADFTTTIGKDPNLAEAYYRRGYIFAWRGELDLAIADLNEAIRCQPSNAQLFVDRGMMYGAKDEVDSAIASFDSALKFHRTHAGAFIQRAAAYARKGDSEKGLRDVSKAMEEVPRAPALPYARAVIYLNRGIVDKAVADCHAALQLLPEFDLAFLTLAQAAATERNWPEVVQNARKALELNPKLALAHHLLGRALIAQAKYDEAIAELDQAVRLEPAFMWARYYRAQAYAYRQEYSRALDELREAVERFPKAEVPHLALGWFLATCPHDAYRDGNAAVAEATRGCEISRWSNWYALDALGAAYAENGDFEEAIKFATQALGMPGSTPKEREWVERRISLYEHGIAARDMGGADLVRTLFEEAISAYANQDFERALKCFNLVLPPNPGASVSAAAFRFFDGIYDAKNRPPWAKGETAEMTNGFFYRGVVYGKLREWDEAIADLSTALRREPASSQALAARSFCWEHKGVMERASRDVDQMLEINPDDPVAYAVSADQRQIQGQGDAALELAANAIRLDPKLALPHEVRGRVFAARNNLEEADHEFSEAQRLEPKHIENLFGSAYAFQRRRDYRHAEKEFREMAARFPRSAYAQNAAAWFLATCPETARRDGAEALKRAKLACELGKWSDPGHVDTLAAAYAEAGDFKLAVRYVSDAVGKEPEGTTDRKEFEKHLLAFQRHQPWHDFH
jgi:tetratricopeptide (TPR) repeat protein